MEIKVLGSGCATCHKLYESVKQAVAELGADLALGVARRLEPKHDDPGDRNGLDGRRQQQLHGFSPG